MGHFLSLREVSAGIGWRSMTNEIPEFDSEGGGTAGNIFTRPYQPTDSIA
jgi:hypothetical protein